MGEGGGKWGGERGRGRERNELGRRRVGRTVGGDGEWGEMRRSFDGIIHNGLTPCLVVRSSYNVGMQDV